MAAQSNNSVSIDAALGHQELANEQQDLLELIDKLQFAQLNVKLPQIVVVGDQSAGKSSVLEAITRTPFPRDSGACTRFATEIRLRRSNEEKFTIRIIPDTNNRTPSEQKRLKEFGESVDPSMSFQTLMKRAVDQIAPKDVPGRFATGDILVVEKRGPKMPLLTVVDLPGLVNVPNPEQSADDIKAINDLTDRYMKSSRTIILAVVGGNNDYVQAPILTKVRKFDPSGSRTIGVLTKPDLTKEIGLEDKFIGLVNNKDRLNHFDLGWYVLLNPAPREPGQDWPSSEERKQAEDDFFMKGKWSTLPPTMCGAGALKQKLSVQLHRHIARHVPTLQKEIQKEYDECEKQLNLLGTGKDTVEEMKEELVQLCSDSKDLVGPAVHGTYTNPPGKSFFPRSVDRKGTPPQKLRARVVEENRQFAEKVRAQGKKLQLIDDSDTQTAKGRKPGSVSKKEFARKEVEPLLRQNMGTEFPMDHNPRLVYTLFQSYSENWAKLAQEHKNNLGVICNDFLAEVIDNIWPHRMRVPLRTKFLDPQMKETRERAQEQVDLLRTDLHLEIQPYDPEYEERLRNWRTEASKDGSSYTEAEEVLEKMLIYYELSAKTFTSNVITQVVERHLLQGLHGIFSWVKINRMDEETVLAIAAENKATREKRIALKAKKSAIEEARDFCAGLSMRTERTYGRDVTDSAEESSDEEESNSPIDRHQRQSINRKPTETRSATSTPLRPQRQQPREERSHSRLANGDNVPNPSSDYDFATLAARNASTAKPDMPTSPSGWEQNGWENQSQSMTDHYTAPANAPQYAPPPPPRPEKIAQGYGESYYPPPTPDSAAVVNRNPFAQQQEQYPVQPLTNGHQHSGSYSQSDLNGVGAFPNGYAQSPAKQKPQRKLFGGKA